MVIISPCTPPGRPPDRLRLAPEDIEEALTRCGWTILNTATEISREDRATITRLEAQAEVAMPIRTPDEAHAWWVTRLIR